MNQPSELGPGARRFEPVLVYSAIPGRGFVRWTLVAALGLAPLAIGCRHPQAYIPLLTVAFGSGLYSVYRERRLRAEGVPMSSLPGRRALLALCILVALQLVPMPPALLRWVSPGSFAFYNDPSLVPLAAWKPITASPPDTLRGLVFLMGMSLLYRAAYRELDEATWRKRLAWTIVGVGFVMTVEALVQQAYSARIIYGIYKPRWDWAVFGPYINKNLFAGYMLMAVPLGIAFTVDSLDSLRRAWGRRRRGWLALGDAEASAFFRWVAVAMVLVSGLLATRSRGGVLGFAAVAAALAIASRQRALAVAAVALVAALGVAWIGLGEHGLTTRGFRADRLAVWLDSARLIPLHPLLGSGFNAFGTAYPPRQQVWRSDWVGATHNEYLQIAVDLGIAGVVPAGVLLVTLVRKAFRGSRHSALQAGLFAAVSGILVHNLVDYNWQAAANAATFAALAGLAVQPPPRSAHAGRGWSGSRPNARS